MSNELAKKFDNLSLSEIENYGSEVQLDISDSMTQLLKDTKCIDLGQTGTYLSELSSTTDDITKNLEGRSGKLFKIRRKAKNWVARYDDIENSLMSLDENICKEKEKLNNVLNGLLESKNVLATKLKDLEEVQEDLSGYVEYLKANTSKEDDGLKLQAAVNRLKVITTTVAVTKQECAKTVLVIQENKEITNQLTEASQNLIPMFKTMMMNVLATKANAEAVKLRKMLVKTANKLVIENAKQIEQNANDLLDGRTESLINPKTLQEANQIMQRTVQRVIDSTKTENDKNIQLIESLKKSSADLKMLGVSNEELD